MSSPPRKGHTPAIAAGSEPLLRRLVSNLLSNAVRHNHPGGSVPVSTETIPGAALPIRLTVAGSGDVIAAEALERLSEPFYRVRGRVRTAEHGPETHGIGLSIVAAVVDAHGGALRLLALPGGGLSVTVDLPGTGAAITPR